MKVRIPNQLTQEMYIENKTSIVLIGANGAGKTRMSVWIDEENREFNVHRISAQKNLNMPQKVSPTELESAEELFTYGSNETNKTWLIQNGKKQRRWGGTPETHMLNDYEHLMILLMTENYVKSIEYREKHKSGDTTFDNETKLEKIKSIWENVVAHRLLNICAGKIEVTAESADNVYNGSEMSDGERAIFHFIGEVLSVKENSLIIVDEPENHLHKSILVRLWNAIEKARPDCTFIYVTHDLNFASSRVNSQIIWVKEMHNNGSWEYELIDDVASADGLGLEIMGSRQKVLLVEGTVDKSTDRKLYVNLFKEYNVLPLESCQAVIQTTKAYYNTMELNYVEVKGIVDRDRRSDEEIESLKAKNVYTPKVAEIENLFMLPEVIRVVAKKLSREDADEIIEDVKEKTFEFLQAQINQQALLFTKQLCDNTVIQMISETASTIDDYAANISKISSNVEVLEVYQRCKQELQEIIDNKDYQGALRVINNKGLIPNTGLCNKFGWKKDFYIDQILLFLRTDGEDAKELERAFKQYIDVE